MPFCRTCASYTVDDTVRIIQQLGKGTATASKLDIRDAYQIGPVHRAD